MLHGAIQKINVARFYGPQCTYIQFLWSGSMFRKTAKPLKEFDIRVWGKKKISLEEKKILINVTLNRCRKQALWEQM